MSGKKEVLAQSLTALKRDYQMAGNLTMQAARKMIISKTCGPKSLRSAQIAYESMCHIRDQLGKELLKNGIDPRDAVK